MAQQEKSIAFEVLKVALGGIAGLCIAVVGLRLIFGIDVIEGIAKRPPRSKADENRPVLPTVSQPSDSRTKTSADPEDAGAQQPNSEAQQAKRAPPEGQWTYGYGKIDAEEGRVVDFHVLPHFNGRGWVDSPQFPNGPLTWAGIESNSVHPSHDPNSVVIRRWTSLDVGKVTIQSFVEHIHKESDGVRAYIVSSSAGVLWKDTLLGNRDVIQLDNIDIQRGDTIDFCLDCNATVGHDHTIWFATIKMHSPARDYLGTWNSLVDFAVPSDTSGDGQSQTAKNSTPAEPMTLPASPTGKEPPPTESAPAAPVGSAESPPSRPHAVPSKEEQDRLRVEIVEVFELEKAKTVADHLALAKRLREVAADAKSKPNERFVLLRTAYDEVIAGRDFAQAFDVVEELAREYEFDREVAIRETLVKLVPEAKSQASWELVELRANELCSRFEQFEEFGASHALMQLIAPELKSCPNQELRRRLQAAADRASFIHDAWQAAKRGRAALKDAPMDPGAHLALARWRAFVLGDWEGSLDHFAAAGDEQLRKLAELEKKPPATAEEMEACAEAWLIASKSRDDLRPGVERAIYWYQSAFPVASGLLKVRIERRLAEIAGDEILGSIITKVKIGGVAVVPSAGNYVRNVLSGTVWSWSQADANQPDKSWFRLNYDGTAVAGWHGQPCFWAARENGSVWLLLAANR
ncbi:MAG TPA: hypothetical protein VMP01_05780, partial [Pirellulaceae bacterium]|nr:hypothetical protein [Pirellulaceae bacterium]